MKKYVKELMKYYFNLNENKTLIEKLENKIRQSNNKLHKFPRNYNYIGLFEKTDFSKSLPHIRKFNKYEIPIIKNRDYIYEIDNYLNEISIYDIPEAKHTYPTKYSLDCLKKDVPGITDNNIETFYYKDKPENDKSIAMTILIYWEDESLNNEKINVIKHSLKMNGYYLTYEDKAQDDNGTIYRCQYYEPYWLEKDLIRTPDYIYHVTAKQFDENIRKNGFIPKSESDLDYPDRVYFFLSDDRPAMFNHMRSKHNILKKNDKGEILITIYKVKVPDDLVLFLDTRTYDNNGNLIENAVYSYELISPDNIVSSEDVNLIGQRFGTLHNHI